MTAALEGGEWSAARPGCTLPPGKDPVPILQEAGWAPGPVWTGGKSRPHRDSIPDRPAVSSVAIPTELPGPHCTKCTQNKQGLFSSFPSTSGLAGSVTRTSRSICINFDTSGLCQELLDAIYDLVHLLLIRNQPCTKLRLGIWLSCTVLFRHKIVYM